MKKVFQTIIDKGRGNCMQAVVASLFELELEDVPNFIEIPSEQLGWFVAMEKFFTDRGYEGLTRINKYRRDDGTDFLRRVARFDGGINGYLYASVPSQTFEGVGHAVVVDLDLNIVHDPNPNQLALKLTPDDVTDIQVNKKMIIGKTGRIFTEEEWGLLTEEEQDAETHKQNDLV